MEVVELNILYTVDTQGTNICIYIMYVYSIWPDPFCNAAASLLTISKKSAPSPPPPAPLPPAPPSPPQLLHHGAYIYKDTKP